MRKLYIAGGVALVVLVAVWAAVSRRQEIYLTVPKELRGASIYADGIKVGSVEDADLSFMEFWSHKSELRLEKAGYKPVRLSVAAGSKDYVGVEKADLVPSSPKSSPTSISPDPVSRYEAAHPGVLRVGGPVTVPREIVHGKPAFPDAARAKRRVLSPIIAMAVISERGLVIDPVIVRSEHPDLDPYVLSALSQSRYDPALKSGRAVPVFLTVTVLLEAGP